MKKRWLGILLVLCLLVCFAPAALAAEGEVPAAGTLNEVYVSKGGNDETGEGTQEKPVASLAKAVDLAADNATIYVMSDLTMEKCARYYGKDLTITSGEGGPYTVTRGDTFDALSDTARVWYNPAMIEVGSTTGPGTASLTLSNITFDDAGKKVGEYFIQADSEADGNTIFGNETIGNLEIVQDAIIATYNGTGTITLGEGATLKNYGGMSAVRLSGGELIMEDGSSIVDDTVEDRTKGTTITFDGTPHPEYYGPAGAVWMQGGTITMEEGSEISNIIGRAIYNENGQANINGIIKGIIFDKDVWWGKVENNGSETVNGFIMHMRSEAKAVFGPTSKIDGEGAMLKGSGISVLEGCELTMDYGSVITGYDGAGSALDIGGTAYLNGEITGLTGSGHAIVAQSSSDHYIRIGETANIHHNTCSYGVIYTQGSNGEIHIYGKINDNISKDRGGALVLANNGTHVDAYMYDGAEMCRNVSYQTGGAVMVSCGTFTMYGGTISDNISGAGNVGADDQVGGGVYVRRGGQFIMNGGTISGNAAGSVGGNIGFVAQDYNNIVPYIQLNGGTIQNGKMNATITGSAQDGYSFTDGENNDISFTSVGSGHISRYLTISDDVTLSEESIYIQKRNYYIERPAEGVKLGNASTNGEAALTNASTAKGWSDSLLASFWAQADYSQTWVLSGLTKTSDNLPVYALVMPTNAEGNVGTNTEATVYAVTVNADGTWSFTVPGGNTNGYVVGLVQPTTDYGTLTLVANPATLTEDVGGTVNYTATYTPADNLINQLDGSESFTLTITLAPNMTYVKDSFTGLTDASVSGNTITITGIKKQQLEDGFTAKFSATALDTIKAGDTFVTNAVLEGTITVEGNKVPVTLVANATVEVTPKPEDPIEPTDPPYIPPVDPDEPADPDDTGVSDLLNTEDHIQYLFGYPDGTFGPENNMTRAEVAQMFYNLLLDQDVEITKTFDDVPANAWYTKAVNTLASLDIISGVGDNKFEPERSITRAEFTAMAMKFAVGGEEGENIFSDVDENDWFYDAVVNSIQYGWIHGYGDGTFRPNNPITRAEVTAIVNNMLGRAADEDFVDEHADELTPFSDIEKHWAYYHIVEATNDHDYTKPSSGENWTKLN